jgi:hypothetical protein
MKRLVIALLGVGIVSGTAYVATNVGSSLEVVNPRVEQIEVEKEVVVKELEKRILEAQESAREEIETKAQAAYDSAYEQAMKEIQLEVVAQYRKEVQEMETSLSKEVGAY